MKFAKWFADLIGRIFKKKPAPSTTVSPTTTSQPWPPTTTTAPMVRIAAETQALLVAHNKHRGALGLPPLTLDIRLVVAAQRHASWMSLVGEISHVGMNGTTPSDRIWAAGYAYQVVGENLAYGHRNATEVMGDWVESPGHEANIRGQFSNVGFGITQASSGRIYWVANFGTLSGTGVANTATGDTIESLPDPIIRL